MHLSCTSQRERQAGVWTPWYSLQRILIILLLLLTFQRLKKNSHLLYVLTLFPFVYDECLLVLCHVSSLLYVNSFVINSNQKGIILVIIMKIFMMMMISKTSPFKHKHNHKGLFAIFMFIIMQRKCVRVFIYVCVRPSVCMYFRV